MPPNCSVKFPKASDYQLTGPHTVALAESIIKEGSEAFSKDETMTSGSTSLPDLTVAIEDSNNARLSISARDSIPYSIFNPDSQYSACFRIPPTTLLDLPEEECKKRAPRFAIGSSIYTTMTGEPPFEDLNESIVQENFEQGIYPEETIEFPLEIVIKVLRFWSQEFCEIVEQNDQEGKFT